MLMRFKSLTLSLCLMGMSSIAWTQPILVKSEQKIEEYKLDNGFRVVLAPNDKENKVCQYRVFYRVVERSNRERWIGAFVGAFGI